MSSLSFVGLAFYVLVLIGAFAVRSAAGFGEGYVIEDSPDPIIVEKKGRSRLHCLTDEQQQFWAEFLPSLKLDDPEQPIPKPARLGNLSFMLSAPRGSSWLMVYRDLRCQEVGVFLSYHRNTVDEYAMGDRRPMGGGEGPARKPGQAAASIS
jgi:hypothetical protein